MIWYEVGIAYFPFFLGAGGFFAAGATFGAAAASATGSSVWPSAPASTSTTSDQRRWYVETSAYGITCTFGRLRPLRKTFGFAPSVSTSTLLFATSRRLSSASRRLVFGASYEKRSMTNSASSRARALNALLRASARTWRGT